MLVSVRWLRRLWQALHYSASFLGGAGRAGRTGRTGRIVRIVAGEDRREIWVHRLQPHRRKDYHFGRSVTWSKERVFS